MAFEGGAPCPGVAAAVQLAQQEVLPRGELEVPPGAGVLDDTLLIVANRANHQAGPAGRKWGRGRGHGSWSHPMPAAGRGGPPARPAAVRVPTSLARPYARTRTSV